MNDIGSERFSDVLRRENADAWGRAVGHRFIRELCDDSLPDDVMAGYLVQDYRFNDGFMALIGAAVATADRYAPRLRLAAFLGEVAGDENTYFVDALESFGAGETVRAAIPDTAATAGFKAIFSEAADTRDYSAVMAVILVTEWLYLDWASHVPMQPEKEIHAQWVRLHDYPGFHDLVEFLRAEIDRIGPTDPERTRRFFSRAVALELEFFDSAFQHPFGALAR